MNKVIIDIETTGLGPTKNTITEIGAILVDENWNVLKEWSTFVKTNYVPPFITRLTGITAAMTQSGLTINQAMNELASFAQDAQMYAHNAKFDKSFIRHYLDVTNTSYIETPWIDTIPIFKEMYPGLINYKLETLIKEYRLAYKEDHRALSDARHTLTLLKGV